LRDIEKRENKNFVLTTELINSNNAEIFASDMDDDYLYSEDIVQSMLVQISENPSLNKFFDDLASPEGSEIYFKPISDYVDTSEPIDFYTICKSALDKGQTALGYQIADNEYLKELDSGIVINPVKSEEKLFNSEDMLIVFADDRHVSIPQIGGMYRGDYRRKFTLAEHGFRLPSCMDNRPLKFEEWDAMRPQSIYVSATPGGWELDQTGGVFTEQVIRPTGLLDPEVEIRPVEMQVDDLLDEVKKMAQNGFRTLVTTLTKRMAEDLTEYLNEQGVRVRYMHSDIDTIERIEILRDLRLGAFDVLVGINLLREGLDIPECGLVAILDADKEGFLRSETSLIQTIGRAARNENGRVIMYADRITGSMERAIAETDRRRTKQAKYNQENGITPETVKKNVEDILAGLYKGDTDQSRVTATVEKPMAGANLQTVLDGMRIDMRKAAENLEFEEAAKLRDEIQRLEAVDLAVADDPLARQSAIEAVSNTNKPRSTAGRGGTRAYRGKSKPKLN